MQKSQITIVGAGIPGMAMAMILSSQGHDVSLVEKGLLADKVERPSQTTRTAALMQGSLDVLRRAGVWDDYVANAYPLKRLTVIDDSRYPKCAAQMVREDFDSTELGEDAFGYNVSLFDVSVFMAKKLRQVQSINIIENTDITQNHEVIQNADLVIGADGRNSVVRGWSYIDCDRHAYNQSAMTCVIEHSMPHNDASIEFHRSGGPCTFVPYGDSKSAVVWVEKTSDADSFLKLSKDDFAQALQERSRGILGQITLVEGPQSWPLISMRASKLVAQKVALIAEAAHVVSPMGAQGLNISLRDVGALADVIQDAMMAGQPVGQLSVLQRYESMRVRDLKYRFRAIDVMNRMVANDNIFVRGVRRLGLKLMGKQSVLRTMVMQQGLAPHYTD